MPATMPAAMPAASSAEVIAAFSSVVHGLTADINNLQSLAAVRSDLATPTSENSHPNTAANDTTVRLKQIAELVTQLEGTTEKLEGKVREEKKATQEMLALHTQALAENSLLTSVLQNLPEGLPEKKAPPPAIASPSNSTITSASTETSSGYPGLRDISEGEWSAISKSVRGRLTLKGVNDAVGDINEIGERLWKILKTKKANKKFQAVVLAQKELTVNDHEGRFFVSEGQLREDAAFWRGGENSAKGILGLLRGEKRLKQVQGGRGAVTYCYL